ncbi:mannose-1-phosphate guanylyltransferase/mannose-6-phosphate isomerase [Thiohalorhabdus sp.]|uniref:mannose-1-phosphate guanylyltransferase/mannose-6-phosphate isomerase n=1 Tax=Thiohalorhabdus sp. TaxID=3094134 RepID=UPI002FC2D75F
MSDAPARIVPVLLTGGSGTRLWPLSRSQYPKQFLPLVDDWTMLQATSERVRPLAPEADPFVVCNEAHRFLAAEQLREVGAQNPAILLEPEGKNTAPALALAALEAAQSDPAAQLLVLPADHVIEDPEAFRAAVNAGQQAADQGGIVAFGIEPSSPETGYGYIRAESRPGQAPEPVPIRGFTEKPDAATAEGFVASGDYFWNSGIFLTRADTYLNELGRHAPGILAACREAVETATRDMDFIRVDAAAFAASPADSIDYAVMERTENAFVVPVATGWSDVGSWSALHEVSHPDADGNVVRGDVIARDSRNCYLRAEDRLLATAGLENQLVVETGDAVLVASRDRAQEVKELVAELQAADRPEPVTHKRVYRPWGAYEGIANADRYQVKHLLIKPGAELSLQLHHHRAEHWIIVKGTALVERDGESFLLSEDQSTYIPIGNQHRISNPGKIPLELIEVQTGSYLGEDDIVRFEDSYRRTEY